MKSCFKAVFNLETNQSGSYVPHGILNWVISKSGLNYDINTLNNYHPNYHQYKIVFMLVDLEAVGSWSSGGCLIELTSPPLLSLLPSQSPYFSGSTAILSCIKNELIAFVIVSKWNKYKRTKSTNKVWIDQQGNPGQQMQNVNMYPPVSLRIAWNAWQKPIGKAIYSFKWQSLHTHFKLVSTQIFFLYHCLLLWKYSCTYLWAGVSISTAG